MYHKTIPAAAISLALSAGVARAADLTDMFQFHAYGTLDVVHSSQGEADFVSSYLQQTQGAGYTRSWSPDVDSKLAGHTVLVLVFPVSSFLKFSFTPTAIIGLNKDPKVKN